MNVPETSAPRVWRAPVVIAVLTGFGLIGALVGDDAWDIASCTLLAGLLAYVGLRTFAPSPKS